jgi:hypothetical protein
MTPIAAAQIPATVMSAASVAPGLARASTPSGISRSPRMSSSHQAGNTRRAANAPEMVIVPVTISHAPSTIATATRPGPGQAMMRIPAAIDSSPVTTFARRTRASTPEVSASATPWTMNSTPMNVARLRTVQSMPKMRTPATMSSAPLSSSSHQLLATCCAASRVSL